MHDRAREGLRASIEGSANELIAAGLLMRMYSNVSLVDLPQSPYDLVIVFKKDDGEDFIRAQVKTAKDSISFLGGTRGGVDRTYKSGVKTYRQSTKTSDVVIGLHPHGRARRSFDLYFIPTVLIEKLKQGSITLSKVEKLKNNFEFLENCKNKGYILRKSTEYGIIP